MRSFLRKIVLFVMLFLSTILLLYVSVCFIVGNQYNQNYQASLIDKVERLESISEPKIILVGNSNVCFGIDSEMIESTFHMPVVNLGLHGGLGNAFHENIAKLHIGEGDIVIVCHTDYGDDGTIPDPGLACLTLEWNVELWGILSVRDIFPVMKSSLDYVIKSVFFWKNGTGNLPTDDCYTRGAFNEYGDVAYERKESEYTFVEGDVKVPGISSACVRRLNGFNRYVMDCGAVLLIAGYPIGDGEYTPNKSEYQEFQRELEEQLEAEVISDYTDYFFPYSYFYDSCFHLTDEGVRARTEQLIMDMKKYFEKENISF